MESHRKKSVKFSSPFTVEDDSMSSMTAMSPWTKFKKGVNPNTDNSTPMAAHQLPKRKFSKKELESIKSDDNEDSWDAFDAKMFKSKTVVAKTQSKFLELSFSQNKSLQHEKGDFSTCSFQDAKDIIERDEKERLLFMNSNISFSDSRNEGIDQVDAPSLLSFTTYFQQGSSFPDSLLMPGNDKNNDTELPSESRQEETSRTSRSSHRFSRSSIKHHSSFTSVSNVSFITETERRSSNATPSRKESLVEFFKGSKSDDMDKTDIVDYVLNYCKQRASSRLSDVDTPEKVEETKTKPEFRTSSTNEKRNKRENVETSFTGTGRVSNINKRVSVREDRIPEKYEKLENVDHQDKLHRYSDDVPSKPFSEMSESKKSLMTSNRSKSPPRSLSTTKSTDQHTPPHLPNDENPFSSTPVAKDPPSPKVLKSWNPPSADGSDKIKPALQRESLPRPNYGHLPSKNFNIQEPQIPSRPHSMTRDAFQQQPVKNENFEPQTFSQPKEPVRGMEPWNPRMSQSMPQPAFQQQPLKNATPTFPEPQEHLKALEPWNPRVSNSMTQPAYQQQQFLNEYYVNPTFTESNEPSKTLDHWNVPSSRSSIQPVLQQQMVQQHPTPNNGNSCSCSHQQTGHYMHNTTGAIPGMGTMPIVIHIHLPHACTTSTAVAQPQPVSTPSGENPRHN